jgi:cytochrome c553
MSCRRLVLALAVVLVLGANASAFAAGNAARGKELSYTCLGCHGIENYKNAYPNYSVPRLAGQNATYIVAALQEYRSGERSHPTMRVQASSMSDQDMQDIAAYFSSLVTIKPGGNGIGTAPAKVTALCRACHGKDGVGTADQFPTLAGQHEDYLEQSLNEYKRGERKNALMSTFAPQLTAQDVIEIAEYYSQQTPGLETLPRRLTILSGD